MKRITNKTILKQGDKEFQPIEVDGVVYWLNDNHIESTSSVVGKLVINIKYNQPILFRAHENSDLNECFSIVAQSSPVLEEIPVIRLDSYINKLGREEYDNGLGLIGFISGYKSNPNQYTQDDIVKAMAKMALFATQEGSKCINRLREIMQEINSIEVIEVDKHFNIIGL
jgi:hypothetical protein